MGASVTISRPDREPVRVELGPATYVIGRDPALRLCLNDLKASRQHAALVIEAGRAWVRDLGSRNGVLVNQARLPGRLPQRLVHGDRIQIGLSELRYEARAGQVAGPPKRSRISGRGQRIPSQSGSGVRAAGSGLRAKRASTSRRTPSVARTNWWPATAVAASGLIGLLLGLLG